MKNIETTRSSNLPNSERESRQGNRESGAILPHAPIIGQPLPASRHARLTELRRLHFTELALPLVIYRPPSPAEMRRFRAWTRTLSNADLAEHIKNYRDQIAASIDAQRPIGIISP